MPLKEFYHPIIIYITGIVRNSWLVRGSRSREIKTFVTIWVLSFIVAIFLMVERMYYPRFHFVKPSGLSALLMFITAVFHSRVVKFLTKSAKDSKVNLRLF